MTARTKHIPLIAVKSTKTSFAMAEIMPRLAVIIFLRNVTTLPIFSETRAHFFFNRSRIARQPKVIPTTNEPTRSQASKAGSGVAPKAISVAPSAPCAASLMFVSLVIFVSGSSVHGGLTESTTRRFAEAPESKRLTKGPTQPNSSMPSQRKISAAVAAEMCRSYS
jgi:hypothetical protein